MMLSWLKRRSRSSDRSGPRRSKAQPRFVPQIMLLEDRCLLASVLLGPETLVNTRVVSDQVFNINNDRSMDVASDGTAIVAWADQSLGIVVRRLDADGVPLGSEIQVEATAAGIRGNANVAVFKSGGGALQDRFVVVWTSRHSSGDPSGAGVFARTYAADGTPLSSEFQINSAVAGDQRDASVEWISANQFVVAWCGAGQGEDQTVFVRIFDASGAAVTSEIRVPETRTGAKQDPVVIALPNGGFQVAWSGNGPGDANGIFSRQFSSSGEKVGATEFRVNASTISTERQPTIARSAAQLVVAWQSAGNSLDPSGAGIVARRFGLDGRPQGGEFLVNGTKQGDQSDPSVAFLADGGFVVAWRGKGAADADGIYAREFSADGAPRGGERLVNTTVAGTQQNPTVRAQKQGEQEGYVVVWDGNIGAGRTYSSGGLGGGADSRGIGMQRVGDDPIMPDAPLPANQVVWMGDDKHPPVPDKTIIITNNTNRTIFPFLRDVNDRGTHQDPNGPPGVVGSIYDPEDPRLNEYRGYIGYSENGQKRLGLRAGDSITIHVPLVFWDGARIFIATDSKYLTTHAKVGDTITGNPFQYFDFEANGTQVRRGTSGQGKTGKGLDGLVMWYHADGVNSPTDDASAQLTEFTIRDPYQFKYLNTTLPTDVPPLFNYDVSYVDTMMLPSALAATGVPLRNGQPVPLPNDFGWIGASQTVQQFQNAMTAFTSANTANDPNLNGLGLYFDGLGYPKLYNPNEIVAGIKLPSGANAITLSPLGDHRSAYDQNQYELTSGGDGPIEVVGGNGGFTDGTTIMQLVPAAKLEVLRKGMVVTLAPGQPSGPAVPTGTTVNKIIRDSQGTITAVELSVPVPTSNGQSYVFNFKRPIKDYAAGAIVNLWWSWLNYYWRRNKDVMPEASYSAKMQDKDYQLDFEQTVDATRLRLGMRVQGAGMPENFDATILDILYVVDPVTKAVDYTKATGVKLSKLSPGGGTTFSSYTISPLREIAPANSDVFTVVPFDLDFTGTADQATANKFGAVLYSVIDSMATIQDSGPPSPNPKPLQLIYAAIGCLTGKIPHIGQSTDPLVPASDNRIAADLRDKIKSLLRGVYDFKAVPESSGYWYPDPSLKGDVTGQKINGAAAKFNVYNLDPFVWFVHKQLGLSGYGFSVDDDTADVEADYDPNSQAPTPPLQIAIQGLNGINNKAEWTTGAQYGPVPTTAQYGPNPSAGKGTPVKNPEQDKPDTITGLNPGLLLKVWFTDAPNAAVGALVNGPGIQPGTRVAAINYATNTITLDTKLDPSFTPVAGADYFYSFFGPVNATGSIDPKINKNKITGLDPEVIRQLLVIAAGAKVPVALVVTGPGIRLRDGNQQPIVTRVVSIDPRTNSVLLDPARPLDPKQKKGAYVNQFTFS